MRILNRSSYYLSGIFQDISIGLAVLMVWVLLGNDISPDQDEIVTFDGGFLVFLSFSLLLGSIVFYFIFTRLPKTAIRYTYALLLLSPFLLTIFELSVSINEGPSMMFYQFAIVRLLFLTLFLVIGIVFAYIYAKGIPHVALRNLGIIISSVVIGRIMAIFFELPSIVAFAIIISLFDIYSVFRGPISKVMGRPEKVTRTYYTPNKDIMNRHFANICRDGTPVLLSYQNTILGIGDVLFFAILMYYSLIIWNILGFIVTITLIILGSTVTLYFLQKISPLPGLPFPVFAALFGYGLLYLLFGV